MSYGLYQDPMQSQPMVIPDTGIGLQMVPGSLSFMDPVFMRHVLCLMLTIRNLFHVYLCWRQLRICNWQKQAPRLFQSVMSLDEFNVAKKKEMHAVEQQLISYIVDAIFSCLELYLGVFPYLWKIIIDCYSIVDDLSWQSIAFVALASSYVMLRQLPAVLYNKLVLEPFYGVDEEKTLSLVGVLCTTALLVVLVQVVLIPLTTIFLFIEEKGGRFFVLWIWGFLFGLSVVFLIVFNTYGTLFYGKTIMLPDGDLKKSLAVVMATFKFPRDNIYILTPFHTTPATAYALGCGKNKYVLILENLLWNHGGPESMLYPDEVGKGLKDNQLVAYIVHELAHYHFWHKLKIFCLLHATLLLYLMIFGLCYRVEVLYEAAGFSPRFYPPIVGYWLVYKYVMPAYLTITNWIIFFFLRRFEYVADRHCWNLGYSYLLINALLKLFNDNPMFPYVDRWYLMWHRMRPTTLRRVKQLNIYDGIKKGSRIELI